MNCPEFPHDFGSVPGSQLLNNIIELYYFYQFYINSCTGHNH